MRAWCRPALVVTALGRIVKTTYILEANGDFDRFTEFVHRRMQAQARSDAITCRLQSSEPLGSPQPVVTENPIRAVRSTGREVRLPSTGWLFAMRYSASTRW